MLQLNRLPFVLGLTIWDLSLSSEADPDFNEFACVISSWNSNKSPVRNTALFTAPLHQLLTEDCGEMRRQPVLGRHRGVVLINDLLVATFGLRLLLRDTGRLQRRTGGAGGSRLIPELFRLLLNIRRTGVFGREMEVLGSSVTADAAESGTVAVVAADDDADEEFNSSWELSLDEEQLQKRNSEALSWSCGLVAK